LGYYRNDGERESDEASRYHLPEHVTILSNTVLWGAWKRLGGNA
jgi:hypothetical protein